MTSTERLNSKTPGTEDGVLEPIPTFSTCYSAPFIVLHVSLPDPLRLVSSDLDHWIARKVRRDVSRPHGQAPSRLLARQHRLDWWQVRNRFSMPA